MSKIKRNYSCQYKKCCSLLLRLYLRFLIHLKIITSLYNLSNYSKNEKYYFFFFNLVNTVWNKLNTFLFYLNYLGRCIYIFSESLNYMNGILYETNNHIHLIIDVFRKLNMQRLAQFWKPKNLIHTIGQYPIFSYVTVSTTW